MNEKATNTQTRESHESNNFSPRAFIIENSPRGLIVILTAATLIAVAFAAFAMARYERVLDKLDAVDRRSSDVAVNVDSRISDMQQRFDTRVNDISSTVDSRLSDAAIRGDELRRDNRIMADDLRTIRVVLNNVGLPSSHEEVEEKQSAAATLAR